jgi:hypothetical protein
MLNSCATGRKQADAPSQVKSFKDQQKQTSKTTNKILM